MPIKINKQIQTESHGSLPCRRHLKSDPFHKSNFRYTTVHITLYRKVTTVHITLYRKVTTVHITLYRKVTTVHITLYRKVTTVHITLYRKVTTFILVLKNVLDRHSVNITKDVIEYFLHFSLDISSQLRHRLPLKYYIKCDKELDSLYENKYTGYV